MGLFTPSKKGRMMKTIVCKYHGPTNFLGSRIIVSDGDNRKTYSWRCELNANKNYMDVCFEFCLAMNWKGTLQGGHTKDGAVFCFIDERMQVNLS